MSDITLSTANQDVGLSTADTQPTIDRGTKDTNFTTPITKEELPAFLAWKKKYAPNESGEDYDIQGAFKAGLAPDTNTGKFADTFKKPNNSTFSDESIYKDQGTPGKRNGDEFIAPGSNVKMQDTQGNTVDVPFDSIDKNLKNGLRFLSKPEQEQEDKVSEGVAYEEQHRIKQGLKRFGNEALLGIPNYIIDKDAGPEQAAINNKVRDRTSALHPTESAIEKTAGFLAPLAIPGVGEIGEGARIAVEGGRVGLDAAEIAAKGTELGEAAFKSAADISLQRKIVASTAKYAAEGAVFSSPQAAVQLAYGDNEKAAETMLWGVGVSGLLGGAGRLVGEVAPKIASKVSSTISDKLSETDPSGASKLTNLIRKNVLNISDKEANRIGPNNLQKIVDTAIKEGIVDAAPEKQPQLIQSMLDDSAKRLKLIVDNDLEPLLKNPKLAPLGPVPSEVANQFQQELLSKFPEIQMEVNSSALNEANKIINDLSSGGSEPSFRKLQDIRTALGNTGKGYKRAMGSESTMGSLFTQADQIIKLNLERSAQDIFNAGEVPEKFAEYLTQKQRSFAAQTLSDNVNLFKNTGKLPSAPFSLGHLGEVAGIGQLIASGHPVGAIASYAANTAYKAFVSNKAGLLGKSLGFLRKAATDPEESSLLGGLMAKEGVNSFQAHLDKLPKILSKDTILTHSVSALNPIQALLGNQDGVSAQSQYEKLTQAIQRAAIDTNSTATLSGSQSQIFTSHNPALGQLVINKQLGALNYLSANIPKQPPPKPFSPTPPDPPSKKDMQDFLLRAKVVADPMSVFKHYQDGTLSKIDKETLQAVYPRLYQEMQQKIIQAASDPKQGKLSHQQRLQMSLFTGVPLDDSLRHINQAQEALASPMPNTGSAPKGKRVSSRPKFERSGKDSLQTESQRRTYK